MTFKKTGKATTIGVMEQPVQEPKTEPQTNNDKKPEKTKNDR